VSPCPPAGGAMQIPTDPPEDHDLDDTDESWSACEERIKRFEKACQQGAAPLINDYLTEGDSRLPLLIELVHIDLEFRLKSGEPARVEGSLDLSPNRAGDGDAAVGLIAVEYALRRRTDPRLAIDEYLQRFPQWHDALLDAFGLAKVTRVNDLSVRGAEPV